MRLAVYTDFPYHRSDERLHAEQAFALFVVGLRSKVSRLVLVGRLDPDPASARHPLPGGVEFVALPHYPSLGDLPAALGGMARSLIRFWRLLEGVDAVWLLGPHPLSVAFAALARLRKRAVVLGIRQDLLAYVSMRHPGRRTLMLAARMLEGAYRLLARRLPTVVVGPVLSHHYRSARRLLVLIVSLVRERDLEVFEAAAERAYEGELQILSIGRLDAEKNPLMLADLLADLDSSGDRRGWRLVVCGDGALRDGLAERLDALGVARLAELRGYLPIDAGLADAYAGSHFLVLTSWTEGFPQVVVEAFAARLPVVSTDVGGIREEAGEAVELVPPGDSAAMAAALTSLADSPDRRARLVAAGSRYAADHTMEAELERLARFFEGGL